MKKCKISKCKAKELIKKYVKWYKEDGLSEEDAKKLAVEDLKADYKW